MGAQGALFERWEPGAISGRSHAMSCHVKGCAENRYSRVLFHNEIRRPLAVLSILYSTPIL